MANASSNLLNVVVSLYIFSFCFNISSSLAADHPSTYNVVTFGAKPNGKDDSTKAFLSAWAKACGGSTSAATIYVPRGSFLLRSAVFKGPCKSKRIIIRIDGTLVAPSDYKVIGNNENWLFFEHVNGVSINGGILDGQGAGLWACKNSGKDCPSGTTTLRFSKCNNVEINGLTSLNSQLYHIVFNGCHNVKLQGVKVSAPGNSRNTDGIHVQSSSVVSIMNSRIATGDDCVSIGPGTNGLWIENIACGPGHGISIGSLGKNLKEDGVQNVTVRTATFKGTQNGLRIKSWGQPSSGFARNIVFQHAVMSNVQNPIIINQHYCPDHEGCPGKASGVRVTDVVYQDIHGTSATEVAVKFDCSSKYPCSNIRMEDVKLTYKSEPATASCSNADGLASGTIQPSSCF